MKWSRRSPRWAVEMEQQLKQILEDNGLGDWRATALRSGTRSRPAFLLEHRLSNHMVWRLDGPVENMTQEFVQFILHEPELRWCQNSGVHPAKAPLVKGLCDAIRPDGGPEEFVISRMLYTLVDNKLLSESDAKWLFDSTNEPEA